MAREGKDRFTCWLDNEERALIKFAMKCTGLNMTTTIRLMIRRGIIDEIIKYKETGVPKITAELQKLIDEL
jgi:hypothetical protein